MKINHGLVVETPGGQVVHFVGYEAPPTEEDRLHFVEELTSDPEFSLPHKLDYYKIRDASNVEILVFASMVPEDA